jgi:hypothetical protein
MASYAARDPGFYPPTATSMAMSLQGTVSAGWHRLARSAKPFACDVSCCHGSDPSELKRPEVGMLFKVQ